MCTCVIRVRKRVRTFECAENGGAPHHHHGRKNRRVSQQATDGRGNFGVNLHATRSARYKCTIPVSLCDLLLGLGLVASSLSVSNVLEEVVHLEDAPRHDHDPQDRRCQGERHGAPNAVGDGCENVVHLVDRRSRGIRCVLAIQFNDLVTRALDEELHLIGVFGVLIELRDEVPQEVARIVDAIQHGLGQEGDDDERHGVLEDDAEEDVAEQDHHDVVEFLMIQIT
mmetsp:Transcript_23285/g.64960  ORF Transcript_23285/g.64960 Transcript_23285/m.64960 type:complete len:226 (-) Transcript_23285:1108-1785(-)